MKIRQWRALPPHELFREMGALGKGEFDSLPFGAILLSPSGVVRQFNARAGELSSRKPATVIGRNFFEKVAPSSNVWELRARFLDVVWRRELDVTFDCTFDLADGPRPVRIRLATLADSVNVLATLEALPGVAHQVPPMQSFDHLAQAISA